ncbi:MAG: N-acetylmuramoyl-L-alanine amidase-like domain-containing protein [Ignavibacteriota bacterium]
MKYLGFILWLQITSGFTPSYVLAQVNDSSRLGDATMWITATDGCYGVTVHEDANLDTLVKVMKEEHFEKLPIGERIVAVGKLLLERPYLDKSLEATTDESITVCNFLGFDCVTFFETSWALAETIRGQHPSMYVYTNILTNHRYRGGDRNGYQSRLHYTSDYFYDNANRENLKEMTKLVGGKYAKLEEKPINFMSSHPNLYPQLQSDARMVVKIDSIKQMMRARGGFSYIPKANIETIEKGIHTGDLIGITTSIAGIDCSHTGIALKAKDGRVHFMHASSAMHKVIISPMPLADYLAGNSKQTGIMVFRPIEEKTKW